MHNRISLHQTIKHNNAIILWKSLVYNEKRKKISVTHRDVQKSSFVRCTIWLQSEAVSIQCRCVYFSFSSYTFIAMHIRIHTHKLMQYPIYESFFLISISFQLSESSTHQTDSSSIWYGCCRYYYFLCHWCCFCCCCCFWLLHVMCVCVSGYIFSWWYKLDITINAYVRSRTQLNKLLSTKVDR